VLQWLRALRTLLDAVLAHLDGEREPLQPLIRRLDAAYAALVATAIPLRGLGLSHDPSNQITQILSRSTATRQYARSLAGWFQATQSAELPGPASPALQAVAEQLRASLQSIEDRLTTGAPDAYVRSASLVASALDEQSGRPSPLADALNDFALLDGALA